MASADMIREAQDPSTSGARLAELAQLDRDLWTAIAVHPAAYPALLEWLGQQGEPTVDAVLAMRSGSPAAAPAPAGPPPPPAEAPAAHAAHAAVPPTSNQSPSAVGSSGSGDSKNLWVVCGMVAVVLLLVGGVAFGATKVFGGDDDKDEASPSQTVDAPESPSDDSSDAPEPSDPPTVDSNIPFCTGFRAAQQAIAGAESDAPGSAAAAAKARSTAAIIRNIERTAPAEVKSDVGILADYFEAASDPSTIDPSTISERVQEFGAAAKRLSTYYSSNCM
ncbi:MAG: hypothetical protein ABWY58_09465 [Aeromicrobium sp.]